MFEWLSEHYLRIIANFEILFGQLVHCFAVDSLRYIGLTLLAIFLLRLLMHSVLYCWMRLHFSKYDMQSSGRLVRVLRRVTNETGLNEISIHQFTDANPLIFTTGTFHPLMEKSSSVSWINHQDRVPFA